jgi:hypothetical protein
MILVPGSRAGLFCDISLSAPRPYVTTEFRGPIFNLLHGLSQSGAKVTTELVTRRFVWPGVRKNCHERTRACLDCQRSKVVKHVTSPVHDFALPTKRFSNALGIDRIDLIRPLPFCHGFSYCLTAVVWIGLHDGQK